MIPPPTKQAIDLFHRGQIAFSEIEANGIRIDEGHLNQAIIDTDDKIKKLQKELHSDKVFQNTWKRAYGDKSNIGSGNQLAHVFFDILGYQNSGLTEKGNVKVDQSALESIDHPFIKNVLYLNKLKKARSTYLEGIRQETVDGFLHPFFNLHLVSTMRSSSDSPNFQNFPTRDPEIGALIRNCFIPRKGRRFIEIDYGAMEFRIAACFWRDRAMVEYASNPKKDIHRDMAAECYGCQPEEVSKQMRYCAKNMLVFPLLYGSWYVQCAKHLWEAVNHHELKLQDGYHLADHLNMAVGIGELGPCDPSKTPRHGTFEAHIKQVEDNFKKRFATFHKSQDIWWKKYLERGWFQLMTGFVIAGSYSKNFLMNCPIQGPAFHCLLQSLIWLLEEIREREMKSLVVGQIHDCSLGDVLPSEQDDYIALTKEILTTRIRKEWSWIITPLEAEVETCPIGGSWFNKKSMEMAAA